MVPSHMRGTLCKCHLKENLVIIYYLSDKFTFIYLPKSYTVKKFIPTTLFISTCTHITSSYMPCHLINAITFVSLNMPCEMLHILFSRHAHIHLKTLLLLLFFLSVHEKYYIYSINILQVYNNQIQ